MDRLLLVVHPWYYAREFLNKKLEREYGNYQEFIERLYEKVSNHGNCLMLLDKKTQIVSNIPPRANTIVDKGKVKNGKYRNDFLLNWIRKRRESEIDICGEFLWYYSEVIEGEEPEKIVRELPEDKKRALARIYKRKGELDFEDLRKAGILEEKPVKDMLNRRIYSDEVVYDGCVVAVKDFLEKNGISVNIIRELCYPTKEAKIRD